MADTVTGAADQFPPKRDAGTISSDADTTCDDSVEEQLEVPYQNLLGPRDQLVMKASAYKNKTKDKWRHRRDTYGVLDWAAVFLPCVGWLRTYKLGFLSSDLLAGLSVGTMVIPQGMSYANLAGLPSVFGLYGAFVPVLVYAAFGSSRQLGVGPVAVTSALIFHGINDNIFKNPNDDYNKPLDPAAQNTYNQIAIQLAFLVGILYTLVGLLRLGWITRLLSHAVVTGFTSGAAIIIACNQVKFLLGYSKWYQNPPSSCDPTTKVCTCPDEDQTYDAKKKMCYISFPRSDAIYNQIGDWIDWHSQFQWREFVMSLGWIAMLLILKYTGRWISTWKGKHEKYWVTVGAFVRSIGPCAVFVTGIAISNIFDLKAPPSNIQVLGNIPSGLPDFTAGWFVPMYNFGQTLQLAVIVCIIDVMESISIATTLAIKNKYELDYTQELRGLGYANLAGAFFNSYTTTGSFSRSAVNNDVGAKTPLAQAICGFIVMITLLVLTPIFTNMPKNCQGAIIIVAVLGLVDLRYPVFYWKTYKLDLLVWLTAFLCTILANVETGLYVSIALSILLVAMRVAFPHTAVLGQVKGTDIFRNVKQYKDAVKPHGMVIVRIDAPMYFANCAEIKDKIKKYVADAAADASQPIHFVILDMSPVADIDATALQRLDELLEDYKSHDMHVLFANPNKIVVEQLTRAGLVETIGTDKIFVRVHHAVEYAQAKIREMAEKSV